MPNYLRNDVILVRFPFSDLTNFKVRPGVVINAGHSLNDLLVVPLTNKTNNLVNGEFVMTDWQGAGLNVESAVKRGIFTIHERLVLRSVGSIGSIDLKNLENSLRSWLDLH